MYETNNGDILCAFRSFSLNQTRSGVVMRMNSLGNIIWQKKIGDPNGNIEGTRGVIEDDVGNECRFTINGDAVINGCNIDEVFTTSGCYTINLEVETVNGCLDDLTLNDYICIDDYPIAEFTFTPDELSSFEKESEFTNTSTGATTYEWNFGD